MKPFLEKVMRIWTAEEWIDGAVFDDGVYWQETDDEDHRIEHHGSTQIEFGLRGDDDGSITVSGEGDGGAFRDGIGYGNAHRYGSGNGSAIRAGSGDGDAFREDEGYGDASRRDEGEGDAYRLGSGAGDAHRDGLGDGDANRSDSGDGNASRRDGGYGDACRYGRGLGDAIHDNSGDGDAYRAGEGKGDAVTVDRSGVIVSWKRGDGTIASTPIASTTPSWSYPITHDKRLPMYSKRDSLGRRTFVPNRDPCFVIYNGNPVEVPESVSFCSDREEWLAEGETEMFSSHESAEEASEETRHAISLLNGLGYDVVCPDQSGHV